jgi:hypothetical protein
MARLPDAAYLALLTQVVSTASASLADYPGATAARLTAFGSARDDFNDALNGHNIAQDTARAKTLNKDEKRDFADVLCGNSLL